MCVCVCVHVSCVCVSLCVCVPVRSGKRAPLSEEELDIALSMIQKLSDCGKAKVCVCVGECVFACVRARVRTWPMCECRPPIGTYLCLMRRASSRQPQRSRTTMRRGAPCRAS